MGVVPSLVEIERRTASRIGLARAAAVVVAVGASAAILLRYYDRMWLPHDDGYYAHIAARILDGEVLHRDVQAMHPDYVYFVDALALRVFGYDLVSLRYPLVALGVADAAIVALMFLRRSALVAAVAAVAFTSLSYVLFPTPSVHWYCLFLLVAIVAALRWIPRDSPWRPIVAGLLVGILGLFRQLTGAFVGIGVMAYLLAEPREPQEPAPAAGRAPSKLLARALPAVSAALIAIYFVDKSPLAVVLFGVWVPALLALSAYRAERRNGEAARLLLYLALGAAVAAAPLFAYHFATGSIRDWYRDSVASAVALSDLEYVKFRRYGTMFAQAAQQVVRPGGVAPFVNGWFWMAVMVAPALLGTALLGGLLCRRQANWPHPLPFLAVFYAPVAIHYEAPAYILFVAAPTVVGLMWLVTEWANSRRGNGESAAAGRRIRAAATGAALTAAACLSLVALRYQAAQPVTFWRTYRGAVAGVRGNVDRARGIDRVSLGIGRGDVATYSRLLELIRRETNPGDAILAVPGGAELHFLSGRRNPLPYPYIVYGVMDEPSLARALAVLHRDPPKLVFHVPSLAYNTPFTDRLMDDVRSRYTEIARVDQFHVYVRNPSP